MIRDNGIGTVLPAPGQGVYVHALTVTGSEELEVTRSTDGTLELEEVGDETEAAQIESAVGTESSPGECSDRAYTDRDHAVKGDPVWYFNPRPIPNELSRESALCAITQRDGEHPEHAKQLRSWKRRPQPRVHGLRRLHQRPGRHWQQRRLRERSKDGSLLRQIAKVGARRDLHLLLRGDPGYERVYWSDIKINKTSYNWTTRPGSRCKGKHDLASTVTHERGHTFGLGHVSESSHARLTMSDRSNGPCQSSEGSLGLGDWKGLCGKYRDPRDC